MKAIGFSEHLDIKDPKSLFEFETPKPTPKGHDLLVKLKLESTQKDRSRYQLWLFFTKISFKQLHEERFE